MRNLTIRIAIRDAMVSQKKKKLLIFCLPLTERDSSLKRLHNRGSVLLPKLPLLSHQPSITIVGISGPHRRGNLFVSPSLIGELQWGVHYKKLAIPAGSNVRCLPRLTKAEVATKKQNVEA